MVVLNLELIIDFRYNSAGSLRYVIDEEDADGAFKADLFLVVRVHGSVRRKSFRFVADERLVAEEK